MEQRRRLTKAERLSSLTIIGQLFGGDDSLRASAFPLRAVFMRTEKSQRLKCDAMLVSVPKRKFKHATDRNRIKRQVREAYRQNKDILRPLGEARPDMATAIAFVYLSASHTPSDELQRKMRRLLHLIVERLQQADAKTTAEP